MAKNIKTPKYLLIKRAKIIKFLKTEGYINADIAIIFNLPESSITRIIKADSKYKGLVKKILSDRK